MAKNLTTRSPFSILKLSVLVTFICLLGACKRNDYFPQRQQLSFTSDIAGTVATRAIGSQWESGDKIGVYMLNSGTQLSETNIVSNVNNTLFSTDGSVFQSAAPVYLESQPVDFIAYYPYKSLTGFNYSIDITDQSNQSALDLMYADNAKSITATNSSVPLLFNRQLARLAINVTVTNTQALDVAQLTATLSEAKTKADFNLVNGALTVVAGSANALVGKVTPQTGGKALVEFTLLPGENIAGKKISFKSAGTESFTWTVPANFQALAKAFRYSLDIKIDNGTPSGGPVTTQPYLEIPTMATLGSNEMFVFKTMPGSAQQRNYSMLYDKQYKMAYWVAYPLHSTYIGSSGRTDDWEYDPDITQSFQPRLFSGFSASGFDRGHQIPSADRTSSAAANRTTFYFSNMTAQNSRLNQGIWASLENKIRTWTAQCDTMYVVTGAMPTTASNTTVTYTADNSGAQVAVPKYYFKALAMKKGTSYYTIGYKMDNADPGSGASYTTYQVTVSSLEQLTGFTFFPDLNATQKGTINTSIWN